MAPCLFASCQIWPKTSTQVPLPLSSLSSLSAAVSWPLMAGTARYALCELCGPTGSAQSFCSKCRRLLFSWNESYKDDIRQSTVSQWLREVITAACARPRSELSVFTPRLHEIKAWVSSLAFANNVSLSNLIDAAYWKSPGTVIQFYLRDVSPAVHLSLLCPFSFHIFQTLDR